MEHITLQKENWFQPNLNFKMKNVLPKMSACEQLQNICKISRTPSKLSNKIIFFGKFVILFQKTADSL